MPAGPLRDASGLLTATVDIADRVAARCDLDVSVHSARPDVFHL